MGKDQIHGSCEHGERIPSCLEIVPIFNTLSYEEMDEIAMLTTHKKYKKSSIVYSAGDKDRRLYVIHEGKIKVSRFTEDGKEQVIRILGPGEFLGELSLFNNSSHLDHAEALEEANVCIVEGNDLMKHIEKHPGIGFKIIGELSKRLDTVESRLESVTLKSVEARVAEALLEMVDQFGEVELPTTKGNFASQIGMSQETLSRKLSSFQDQKIIKMIGQRRIIILKRKALEKLL